MEHRRIPGTDLKVSPICFGMMYGSASRKKPELKRDALRRGLESGINFVSWIIAIVHEVFSSAGAIRTAEKRYRIYRR